MPGHAIVASSHVPFGVGLRSCQGQRLARLETFYVVARIVQEFDLVPRDDKPFGKSVQFTLTPDVACRFVKRQGHKQVLPLCDDKTFFAV